jgi:2-alkyl-3-oxoalkanoate reductase
MKDGDIVDQAGNQKFPVTGGGHGVWPFIHVEDAAAATVAALDGPPGVYNVVDDQPAELCVWLPAFARSIGAPEPPSIGEEEALREGC